MFTYCSKQGKHTFTIFITLLLLLGVMGAAPMSVQAAQEANTLPSVVSAAPTNSTLKYFSVLRVVTANSAPFDSLSWEQAAPIKVTDNFQWFEATIYPSAPSAVHLYKFDNTFDPMKWFQLSRQDWVNYRESYRLMKVDIPSGIGAAEKSILLREAFQQFFTTMVIDTPSQHYGIRYSGHGSSNGGLFENQINPNDAQWLFESITSLIGKKVDFLDLGGNCVQGNTAVVANFYPYFDFILASDLLVGGFTLDNWTIEKLNQTDPDYQYPLILTPDKTIIDSLILRLDLFRIRWEYSRNNMIAGQVKQSQSLYKTDSFEALAYSVGQELTAHPVFLGDYHYDLYTYIKSLGRIDVESRFLSFRIEYRSNKDFFPWDVDTNGLSIYSTETVLPDFTIFPPSIPQQVQVGSTVVVDLLIRPRNSFNSPLAFTTQNLPPSSSVTFSPVFGISPMHVSMSVMTSATTPSGTSTIVVTASGGGKTHLASLQITTITFADVPTTYWAWSEIERLYAAGFTTGCGTNPLAYCPERSVTRAEMAVFIERGIHGAAYIPPAGTGTVFADVPLSYWDTDWIEQLYADHITGGCGVSPLTYCPDSPTTRAEMAAFLLKAKHGADYNPPAAVGVFADVPTNYWAASWIERLYAEGITGGCNSSPLSYCPERAVTRAEMAVFLVKTFNLP